MKTSPIYTPEAIALFTVVVPATGNWGKAIGTAQDAADAIDKYLYGTASVIAVDRHSSEWYVQVQVADTDSRESLRRRVLSQQERLQSGGYGFRGGLPTFYTREG